ncbi:hypothetical protein EJB05_12397 [Eragrostis curvula]|uniref:SBP-type domain-containing protein n=1 Tax=Eragrostis curvula TaxID=38414 RepID=A0A5J9VT27_9POAL|nr:hypothetical protein EJB05_12397 [Eragrostis curvula]
MDRKDKSRRVTAAASASMAALAAAAAAGEGGAEEDRKPPKLGALHSGSSSSSSPPTAMPELPVSARRGGGGGGVAAGGGGPCCQADRCGAELGEAKRYHKRHKVCEAHAKAPVVIVAGLRQRFCQQCSRFHELSEFDDIKRSCRLRLAGHNERRRKSSAEAHGPPPPGPSSSDPCRHADQDGRSHPGNPPLGNFQIR